MSCCQNKIKSTAHFSETGPLTKLEHNIKGFLDWGFLEIGAWVDIIPPGVYSELQCVDCTGYTQGQVWMASKTGIIWEPINYTDKNDAVHTPITPSFSPTPDNIDYVGGKVIYNTPLSTTTSVTGTFSSRYINIILASECPWFKRLEACEDEDWSIDSECLLIGPDRVQLPAIIINGFSGTARPKGLGQCCLTKTYEVDLHILAPNKIQRDKLSDILIGEMGGCKLLYDIDLAPCIYDRNGFLENQITYPDLIATYPWSSATLDAVNDFGKSFFRCGLYESIVRMSWEVC